MERRAAHSGWGGGLFVCAHRYCVDCEEFKDEKEMDAEHTCPTHRKPCQHRKEVSEPRGAARSQRGGARPLRPGKA